MYTNSSFIRVSPLLLKWVRSSIFVHDVLHTDECFPDKLPIFTRCQHHNYLVSRFPSDINYSVASLEAFSKNLFQTNETAYLLHSLVSILGIRASQNITEYYDVCVFDRTKIRNQTCLECYKCERMPMFSQAISFAFHSPFKKKNSPDKRRKNCFD